MYELNELIEWNIPIANIGSFEPNERIEVPEGTERTEGTKGFWDLKTVHRFANNNTSDPSKLKIRVS